MRVTNDITVAISGLYSDPKFISMVEQNIDYNVKNGATVARAIPPHTAYIYQGNFYGLLTALGISPDYHAFTAYINNIRSPHDFDGKTYVINVVDNSVIDNISRISF